MDARRAARLLVVAGLCAAAPAGAAAQSQPDPYYSFLLGRHFAADENDREAIAALERAAEADPTSSVVRAEIALLHYRSNRPQAAETAAKQALSLDAGNFEANRVLALIYNQRAEAEMDAERRAVRAAEALIYLERAVAASPNDANLNYRLGLRAMETGDLKKALDALRRVVIQSPYSSDGRKALAQALALSGDVPAAIETLAEITADEPTLFIDIARYQAVTGNFAAAAASLTKALEAVPGNPDIKAARIQALMQAKQYAEAAKFAADAQRQHPRDGRFVLMQASALSDAGQDVEAERVLREAVEANPKNADALNHLGYLLAQNNRKLDEAVDLVTRALAVEPNNGAYLDSLGWAHFRRGDLNLAEKYLTAAAAELPEHSEILEHLGDLHARRGRWQEAIDTWDRALNGSGDGIDPAAVRKKIEEARGKATGNR
jgi:tetratricopeptide (TPR) repeat protein